MGRTGLLIALLVLLAAPSLAGAKRLYKYTDENGIVHFTDRPPDTEEQVDSWLVEAENRPMVNLRRERRGDRMLISAFNRWYGPVELRLEFTEDYNVVSEPRLPSSVVLESYGEAEILTIRAADPNAAWGYRLAYAPTPGDPEAQPEPYLYRPPFRAGARFYIGQAFGGIASHQEPHGYHAVDLTMPEGTPVLAARGGIVMNAQEDFFKGGKDMKRYGARANNVRILHADGTMGVYAHLQVESVAVKPGQAVAAGELLGLSGSTGYVTGPHLHFVIQRNAGGELVSVPFEFLGPDGNSFSPVAGRWLEHPRGR
ncbi:MAG: M23 family metallopeptidase [Xanthomonadales bacterium]|nr:M23 family metallopeptidase [Xanthomonadales bacterium]